MTSQPTRVLVLRHGQSEWNATGRWQGRADTALDDVGRAQAAAAAEVLGSFDSIWSSDLQRAMETAVIIAARLGIGPVLVDGRLAETDVGPWQGLTLTEIEVDWPGFVTARRRPPEAEPLEDVVVRVSECLADIAAQCPGGEVLVVSHAGVLRTMRAACGEEPQRVDNLAGAWFDVYPDGRLAAGAATSSLAGPDLAAAAGPHSVTSTFENDSL